MTAGGVWCMAISTASLLACGGGTHPPTPVPAPLAAPGAPVTTILDGDGYTCFQPASGLSICEPSQARCAAKQAASPGAAACERVGTVWCHASEQQPAPTCRRLQSECQTSKRSNTSCVQQVPPPP